MSVQVEQLSSFQKRLQFNVAGEEVSRRLDDAYRTLGQRVNIQGFRRGKVPRKVLEQRFGRQIRQEVASDIINGRFRDAALDLDFIGQPEVDRADLAPGADFSFAIVVQVKPEVQLGSYTGLKVGFPTVSVADEQVDALVARRLQGQTRLVEVEDDRAVQSGDFAITEITLLENGEQKVLESGTMINTAGDRYYPGVESLIVGTAKGASNEGTVTIADSAELPGLRGRTCTLRVKVLGIQASRVPDLTDSVAAELGYEGGVEAMKAALRMEEEGRATEGARNVARVNLLQQLTETHPVDVPPAMVDSHLQLLLEELRIQAAYRGRDPRSLRYSEAQMADLRNRAVFAARASLVLDAVAKAESIVVTDEDLEAKYQEIADARGQRVEAIRGYFKKDNAVEELRKRLLEERTLEWLLERAELVDAAEGEAAPAEVAAEPAAVEEAPKAKKPRAKKADVEAESAPADAPAEAAPKAKKPRAKKADAE